MPAVSNPRVIFAKVPKGMPVAGQDLVYDTTEQIDLDNVTIPEGGFLVKLLSISLDPYLRGKLTEPNPKHYSQTFELGKPIYNFAVTEVVRSNAEQYPVGAHLYGIFKFAAYSVIDGPPAGATKGDPGAYKVLPSGNEGLDVTTWVGAAGMPGKTAFYGWKAIAKAKKGESVFVSSAYGAVGQIVCQIAKNDGLKVIASAGSDDKVKYLREELGVDAAFNYKTANTAEELEKFGGIDIFWDGVGGETLDAALGAMRFGGRSIECGMISGYNKGGEPVAFKNIMKIIGSGITLRGFLVFEFENEYQEEFYNTIPKMLKSGEMKFTETVYKGLETVPEAFVDLLQGKNTGKVVIKTA